MASAGTGLVSSRWLYLLAAGLALGTAAPTVNVAAIVGAVLLVAGIVPHLFPLSALTGGSFAKSLLFADTLLVSVTLLAVAPAETTLTVALLLTVVFAGLVGDRSRTLLLSVAVLALYSATSFDWAAHFPALVPGWLARLAFLATAALYFGILSESASAESDRVARARRESDELRTLLAITEGITSSLDLKKVMLDIVRRVGSLTGSQNCSILLADEALRQCFVLASDNRPDVDMLEIDLGKYPEIRRALESREPVVIEDVESDPLVASVREVLLEKGYRSALVVPLLFGREVLGTLFLRASRERPFSNEEIRFCRVAAGASANALKNALLYREMTMQAEEHRETGEKLRRILDGTPDVIVATDLDGRVTRFNRGAERLTGVRADQALGRAVETVLPFEDRDADAAPLRGEDGREHRDVLLRRGDGGGLEFSLVTAPLTGGDGERTGQVMIGRDVTHLRRVERSLAQAERLSSLGEVVAGVAHELNNPLSGVVGYAELLRLHSDDDGQLRDVERIIEAARRCQRIVLNLLSFSRKHPGEKRVQDLNACVTKVLELKEYQLRAAKIEPRVDLDDQVPSALFDFHQIEQVILNLINNAEQAIRARGGGGKIVLRTRRVGDSVRFEIEDDGPGVPAEVRDRIFDPFFTTKELGEGTGLGLSVSYGIVQEHDGGIEVLDSDELGGARFAVTLPLHAPADAVDGDGDGEADGIDVVQVVDTGDGLEASDESGRAADPAATVQAPAPAKPSDDAADRPLAGRSILVAEDEPLVLELFTRILMEDGARVTIARDGEEAWEKLVDNEFDLVVTDIRMPNVDGQQLYEKVAEERPDLLRRFVFATGDMVRDETVRFLEALPNRILTKPLQIETVRRVLAQAMS
jgi:two-component system NtrC family sensor kinase